MDPANQGVADGTIGVDSRWKSKLSKLLADTPLSPNLLEAATPLVDLLPEIDLDDLQAVIDDKRAEWREFLYSEAGGFNLPRSYPLDYAVAIYLYTLADPPVFSVVNAAMFNPARRTPGATAAGATGISAELRACMPYIKFLDAALEALDRDLERHEDVVVDAQQQLVDGFLGQEGHANGSERYVRWHVHVCA